MARHPPAEPGGGCALAGRPGNVDAARARLDASRGTAPPKQPAPISLRLEADTVRRLRALAAKKGTKYQTLLKTFVQERLYEEEKREGLVP